MKRIVLGLALLPSLALADRSYNSEKSATHDCSKEPEVSINVSGGKFTFTGTCTKIALNGNSIEVVVDKVAKLAVNGANNTATIAGVDKLAVNGADNKVTYKASVDGKGKPKIANNGTGNKIAQSK